MYIIFKKAVLLIHIDSNCKLRKACLQFHYLKIRDILFKQLSFFQFYAAPPSTYNFVNISNVEINDTLTENES